MKIKDYRYWTHLFVWMSLSILAIPVPAETIEHEQISGDRKHSGKRKQCLTGMYSRRAVRGDFLHIELSESDEIPIIFHIVRDRLGQGGYDPGEGISVAEGLEEIVDYVNGFFPVSTDHRYRTFRFYLDAFFDGKEEEYLRSERFISIEDEEIDEIRRLYNIPGRINVFLVEELYSEGDKWCGISSFPGTLEQGIVMDWRCFWIDGELSSTLTHEIGHYFCLYHTHDTYFGRELVRRDPANCECRGDKLCDTPADPKLGYENVDSLTCIYVGDERDPEGVRYEPDVKNIMSYARKLCREYFSVGQLIRMTRALDNELPGEGPRPLPASVAVRAYPNPVEETEMAITLNFDLPTGFAMAHIAVYDIRGRLVRRIYKGAIDQLDGIGRFRWHTDDESGRPVTNGIYFIRVQYTDFDAGSDIRGGVKINVLR